MNELLTKDPEGRKFGTIAEAKNYVEKTFIYTSKLGDPHYVGRGKGDNRGDFEDSDGVFNQFINPGRSDSEWRNEYHPQMGVWLESCVLPDGEKKTAWLNNRGHDISRIRLYVKRPGEKDYTCVGIMRYAFTDRPKNTVVWKKA